MASTSATCGLRQRGREHEAGEAGAGAEVGDPPRRAHPLELERDERIGDVDVDGGGRIAHGRRRGRILVHELEQALERLDRAAASSA